MLDDSGIFCPLLRHMANPQVYIESATILEFLDQDHTCVFIRDNLKVGTRCGNVLREMNARHDGRKASCAELKDKGKKKSIHAGGFTPNASRAYTKDGDTFHLVLTFSLCKSILSCTSAGALARFSCLEEFPS